MINKSIYHIFLFASLYWLLSCRGIYLPEASEISKESLLDSLEKSFENRSLPGLQNFLEKWHHNSVPNQDQQKGFLVKESHEIFKKFYNPFDLSIYVGSGRTPEVGSYYNAGVKYVIIKDSLEYIFNSQWSEGSWILDDFRPDIEFYDAKVLYLTDEYKYVLENFLSEDQPGIDLSNKRQFLNNYLNIAWGHWGGWHFVTHPEISLININSKRDTAIVYFRIRYEGGQSVMVRSMNEWNMVSSRMTWIE